MLTRNAAYLFGLYSAVLRKRNVPYCSLYTACLGTTHAVLSFWIGQKSVFKVIILSSFLKVKGLKYLGSGPLSKCQKLACTKFVGALYGKPEYTSLNENRFINTAKKSTKKTSSNKQQFLSASSMLHLASYGMERLLLNNKCAPATNRYGYELWENTKGRLFKASLA